MKLKMDCADGIQEGLETVRDLRANNAQDDYMKGLDKKIKAVEKHAIVTELGMAVFVASAQMILKLGNGCPDRGNPSCKGKYRCTDIFHVFACCIKNL